MPFTLSHAVVLVVTMLVAICLLWWLLGRRHPAPDR